jgi:hypothetical protein
VNSKEKFIDQLSKLEPYGKPDYNIGFGDAIAAVNSLVETSAWGPSEMAYPNELSVLNQKIISDLMETIKTQNEIIRKLQNK